MTTYKRKLIEVALPLEAINRESAREKSIRHGHPSTLHLWWARRPLAACRAVLFAQLVDDPSSRPDEFPDEESQAKERKRLHGIIERLVKWENSNDEAILKEARAEIWKSCDGKPPPILDPFAGGGSIPLEAQRLGLEAHASDLNPVAVLINKALIEIPPKWAGRPPVFPGAAQERLGDWPGATGLAEDVRRYGQWMRDEAEKRIGHLYPKAKLPNGKEANVIAWIWARTVKCPSPGCGIRVPLVNSFTLKTRGRPTHVRPSVAQGAIGYDIEHTAKATHDGTVSRAGATCIACSATISLAHIRAEGKNGRTGAELLATVVEGPRERIYLPPSQDQVDSADVPSPESMPDIALPEAALGFRVQAYGITSHSALYTARQSTVLNTLCDLVAEAAHKCEQDGAAREYARDIACYLALMVGRVANRNSSQSFWNSNGEKIEQVFARNALPMIWVYAEANPFSSSTGNIRGQLEYLVDTLRLLPARPAGQAEQGDATERRIEDGQILATDPPYYDNVPYADLSDFFYLWHRRALADLLPELYVTMTTPKADELIAEPARAGSRKKADELFEEGLRSFFKNTVSTHSDQYPLTLFYAFKQVEKDVAGTVSTGWEKMLQALIDSDATVVATWPMRTERGGGLRELGRNSLASSILLACRPRDAEAAATDRRGLISKLREELPGKLRDLQQAKVAPVDLAQAAIGPGMAIFSGFSHVIEPDGTPMRVRAALGQINQVLDEVLAEQEGDFSAETRWCIDWFKTHGFDIGPFGDAETLSKAKNTSIEGLARAGVLSAHANKVTLLAPADLPANYDPLHDDRVCEWEIVLHLVKQLDEKGMDTAAALMAKAAERVDLDTANELAYLLFSICERRGWAQSALLFNALGTVWGDLVSMAREMSAAQGVGGQMSIDDQD